MAVSNRILIEQTKNGDKGAFEELIKAYQNKVYNLNLRLLGGNCHREEAEDLTQETFLNAYKGIGGFRETANFYTWLYRIAINTFNASYRGKPAYAPEPLENWEDKIVSNNNTEEEYLFKEIQEICFSAIITHIPLSERVVFVLSDVNKLSNREIAEILGITEGATKIRLHRARKRLIDFFKNRCSLMKKDNPCKCRMWIDYAREQVKCLEENPPHKELRIINAQTINENLSDLQKIISFYQSLSSRDLKSDTIEKIQEEINKKKIFVSFASPFASNLNKEVK